MNVLQTTPGPRGNMVLVQGFADREIVGRISFSWRIRRVKLTALGNVVR